MLDYLAHINDDSPMFTSLFAPSTLSSQLARTAGMPGNRAVNGRSSLSMGEVGSTMFSGLFATMASFETASVIRDDVDAAAA